VAVNPDGTTTIALESPIEHAKKTITEVTVHEPTAGELEVMDESKGQVSSTNRLIAELSGLSLMAVRKLKGRDWGRISDVVNGYVGKSQGTGATS
jgi:hypothetical protein